MCNAPDCNHVPASGGPSSEGAAPFDPDAIRDHFESMLQRVEHLMYLAPELEPRDTEFAESLARQFAQTCSLSPKQWEWVDKLTYRAEATQPIYGSFDAILVMFRLAGEKLKRPKIRLVSKDDRYILLAFNPLETSTVKVFVDGYSGHGHRKFAGKLTRDKLIPFGPDMSQDVIDTLQDFALDPARVSKAMAAKLGVCCYCGSPLTDEPSKEAGYGPVCAKNYQLPWGGKSNKVVEIDDLHSLFRRRA